MEMSFNGTNAGHPGPTGTRTLLEQTQLEDCMTMAWTLLCTFLVVSMQLGFAMLEVGSVREAHRMTVLAKNVLDSVVSCMVWWARCSFWYTPSIVVEESSGLMRSQLLMFHWAICATCVTICSGAMAERTHMVAYLCCSAVTAGVIYPVIADSAWGRQGLLHGQFHGAWSGAEDYRFHDFSGSGVCHMTGGLSALVGNMLLGRRILKPSPAQGGGFLQKPIGAQQQRGQKIPMDPATHSVEDLQDLEALDNELVMAVKPAEGWKRRFHDEHRDRQEFKACNYLQVMGMFTLWFGWYGFNAGLTVGKHFSHVTAASIVSWNTSLAACSAGFGAYLFCYLFRVNLDISFLANGVLSGLVAITGPCDVASDTAAVGIGFTAGLLVYPVSSRLLRKLYLDDPVDAIAVHASSGLFGVLMVGFCRPNCLYMKATGGMMPEQIRFCDEKHDWLMQMYAQVWGAFTIMWFTVACSFFLWSFFVVSELVRSMEVPFLAQADDLLCEMTTPQPSAEASGADGAGGAGGADDVWKKVCQWSPAAQRILSQHGWQPETGFPGGAPQDHFGLRMELHRARSERETALEVQEVLTYCPFWAIAKLMHRLRFFRVACLLRLRIAPVSELSGLGAADADGGQFFAAVRKVLTLLQDIQSAHSRAHLPLKREVRDLTKMMKHQDAALRRLSQSGRGRNLRSMPRLSSVPEQNEGQPVVRPGHHEWQNFPDGDTWSARGSSGTPSVDIIMPTTTDSQRSDASSQPPAPQPRDNRQLAPVIGASLLSPQRSHGTTPRVGTSGASSRTVSERSAGMLTPHSAGEDTPPPTVIGRLRQATRVPPELRGAQGVAVPALSQGNVHDVVGQLSIMVQAQQELLGLLQQGTPPVNGVQGASNGGLSTPNRQHLMVALEHVARQQDAYSSEGFSNVSTQ